MSAPTGNVTFLFTDIEGSTRLAQEFPDELHDSLEKHHSILQTSIESNNGHIFEIVGDAFCSAFQEAADAVEAAVEIQSNLLREKWNEAIVRVRIGLHSGNVEYNNGRFMGYLTLARTARVMSSAYGEQILISDDTLNTLNSSIGKDDLIIDGQKISFRDLGERRLKDLIQPIKLHQVVSDNIRKDFPPLRTLDARPNNLPVQLTSYIGMKGVIEKAKDLLRNINLLTLLGTGGAGKTRLALQIGADIIDEFANGVFITELASVSEPSLIQQAIMNSLSLKEESGKSPDDTLNSYLDGKEILIILDNCEHLIGECAHTAEKLLRAHPKLKLIATSREALNCAGEQKYKVPSLSVPESDTSITPEQLTQYESVRLFIERALAMNVNFRVNENNAPALADICNRLDGIPLAIELAAARTKFMSVEKIHERLDDRFNLLTGGKRTSLPRQQTLKALIDWSYDLLPENEKLLWSRLSVFTGGFDLQAAEEICANNETEKIEVLDLLHNLADKSVISYDDSKERFNMLDTIRQYGYDKLKSANEFKPMSEKHLEYYLGQTESAEPLLIGNDANTWLNKLQIERGNFESAMTFALQSPEDERGLKIAGSLGLYWRLHCNFSGGRKWLDTFLINSIDASKPSLAKALLRVASLTQMNGDLEVAYEKCRHAYELYKELNDNKGAIEALSNMAMIRSEQGEYDKARNIYEECFNIVGEDGDKSRIAYLLNDLGSSLLETGNYHKAREMFLKSTEMQKIAGDKRGIAYSLYNIGNIDMEQSEFRSGKEAFDECLRLFRDLGDKRGEAYSMLSLGNIESHTGNPDKSAKLIEDCISTFRNLCDKRAISFSLCCLADSMLMNGNQEGVLEILDESLALSQEGDIKPVKAYCLMCMGNAKYVQANLDEARNLFNESLKLSKEIGHKPGVAFNHNFLGIVAMDNGDIAGSAEHFRESILINRETNQRKEFVSNMIGVAGILTESGLYKQAAELLGFADHFHETSGIATGTEYLKKKDLLSLKAKESLGVETFTEFTNNGKKLSFEEAYNIAITYIQEAIN